jgi:hypothetical protein
LIYRNLSGKNRNKWSKNPEKGKISQGKINIPGSIDLPGICEILSFFTQIKNQNHPRGRAQRVHLHF